MTKYEWESELKKNIHRLPDEEIARVMEYYAELFDDKIERGRSEREIIAEFGNPVDVADKILADYEGELRGDPVPPPVYSPREPDRQAPSFEAAAPKAEPTAVTATVIPAAPQAQPAAAAPTAPSKQGGVNGNKLAVLIVLTVLLGGAFFGCAVALWSVVVSIGIAGGAAMLAGFVYLAPSFFQLASSMGAGIVQIGVCVAAVGLGLLLVQLCAVLCKVSGKLTVKFFRSLKNWLTNKKVAYEG